MKNFLDISEISATAIRKIIDDAKIRKAKRKRIKQIIIRRGQTYGGQIYDYDF